MPLRILPVFGLLGHALEMAVGSKVEITFYAPSGAAVDGGQGICRHGIGAGLDFANRNFCAKSLQAYPDLDPVLVDLLSDAQTNGGLLLAVAPEQDADAAGLFRAPGHLSPAASAR